MSAPAGTFRPAFRPTTTTTTLLGLAAVAWVGVVAYQRDMGNGIGSMGLSAAAFLPMWAVMMAAMMLPAVTPVATLYARTITVDRRRRLTLFVGGYLAVWAVAGLPTYGLLRLVDHLVGDDAGAMRVTAGAVLLAAATYQLSPLKAVCLRHCRSPLAQLLHYGNVKGRFRDIRVSLHHAGFCLGCCWALMALFVTFGVMNLWAMAALVAVVVGEKALRRGELVGRAAGIACAALAVAVLASPAVARHVVPANGSGMEMTDAMD